MPNLPSTISCTGCFACVDACPTKALTRSVNAEGHYFYDLDKLICIDCHRCERVCPVSDDEYLYGVNDLALSSPYAAWCLDKDLRRNSTSGGVFAALAKRTLGNGGTVVGAAIVDNFVKHVLIEDITSLPLLQGSKYTQSNTNGIYKDVLKQLKNGRKVLFSGTGCQVAGLLRFLPTSLDTSNLITVDLVCGGVPSNFLIDYYLLKNRDSVRGIAGFRNKEKYEFTVFDKKGDKKVIPLSKRPLPLCGFYTELTNRYSCYDCQFAFTHRKADLTIGDLWGDTHYKEQHENGLSLVIAHTDKGIKALKESEIEINRADWAEILPFNPRIAYGKNILGGTRARKQLSKAFKEDNYQKILDNYANDASFKRPLSIVKKLYRILLIKVNHHLSVNHIKSLLQQ